MAEDRGARAISLGAAIAAALAFINSKKASAAPPGEVTFPKEVVQLLVALAESSDTIEGDLKKIARGLADLSISVQGWPANTDSITSIRVAIAPATGLQMPDIRVPSGMSLIIKAWTLNPGILQVGASLAECSNVNQSFPLLPNEIVAYQVQNANQIYIAANAAGCTVCLTVEKWKGGGV